MDRNTGSHQQYSSSHNSGGSSHKAARGRTAASTSDSGKNQATWRWDCCACSRGAGMNNSYLYNNTCVECHHGRCGGCDVWRTGQA
ncbi:hypothetical protein F4820DRAFT_445468 [Hypoxylon rubiginosum]|uniref:Uncharacterized protein n=1 Tax=Hypoxylon rubiginosum TaxID=110542 RepID=A0ACB9Z909_9PEZI|nr:hypothetical protein F4820DRAFT_445468 [Hypoxylon rubiginosum]